MKMNGYIDQFITSNDNSYTACFKPITYNDNIYVDGGYAGGFATKWEIIILELI